MSIHTTKISKDTFQPKRTGKVFLNAAAAPRLLKRIMIEIYVRWSDYFYAEDINVKKYLYLKYMDIDQLQL